MNASFNTYKETLEYMYSQLPMYQRVGRPAFKPDLDNSYKLMALLDHPEEKFRSIHIAGTNGKGSTAHLITSTLIERGLKTGLYTSPHLKDFRERITVSGKKIPEAFVMQFMKNHHEEFREMDLSFFEMTVGMAFAWFAVQHVDIAVIEVGMGGRLDSTNIITPELAVITNIGLDHTFFLGDTKGKIAEEKAGIIKKGVPVIIGESDSETKPVFDRHIKSKHCPAWYADKELTLKEITSLPDRIKIGAVYQGNNQVLASLETPLSGHYQIQNIRTALMSLLFLKKKLNIQDADIQEGFAHVITNTGLQGRWQKLSDKPLTYCDTAHNADGVRMVMQQLNEIPKKKLHLVLGMVNDKNLGDIFTLLPREAIYYFCKADIPRGLPAGALQQEAAGYHLQGKTYPSVQDAFRSATQQAGEEDVIFVGGSTFTVAEVL